jgi:hypothetical protein
MIFAGLAPLGVGKLGKLTGFRFPTGSDVRRERTNWLVR